MKNILIAVLLLLVSGCATKTIYYWGNYQDLIYDQYENPGKASPELQIQLLEADIQRAKAKNQPLPPGFYAHLGYQYVQAGKADKAFASFEMEKQLYPESATLMSRFTRKKKL